MGELFMNAMTVTFYIVMAYLLVIMFSGAIFSTYFNAKMKYMKELNRVDD